MFGGGGVALTVRIVGDTKDLASGLQSATGSMSGFANDIASKIGGPVESATKAIGGLSGGLGGAALAMGGVGVLAGGAAVAIAGMTKAAMEDEAEQNRLMAAVTAAGAATDTSTQQINDAIAAGQAKAFTDTQSREALMSLVTATGDVTTATGLLSQAQDIARFANVDLATAADAVAKAQAGQDTQLLRMLPGLTKGTDATDTLAKASALAAGQADAYAQSAEGMSAIAKDSFSEIGETIGSAFLPLMDAIMPALLPVIQAFGELIQAILPVLIPMIQGVGKALAFLANMLSTAVRWLTQLIEWVQKAVDWLGRMADKLNPFKDFHMPSLPWNKAAPSAAGYGVGPSAYAAGGSTGGSGVVVNVYTTGDSISAERAIAGALRRVTRINGGVVPAVGWTGGGISTRGWVSG